MHQVRSCQLELMQGYHLGQTRDTSSKSRLPMVPGKSPVTDQSELNKFDDHEIGSDLGLMHSTLNKWACATYRKEKPSNDWNMHRLVVGILHDLSQNTRFLLVGVSS